MSKAKEQLKIKQIARFKCENCNKFDLPQYAHIEPDSQGGIYTSENLLFLCYACHKNLESTTTKGARAYILKNHMKYIKRKVKVDSKVTGVFQLLGDEQIVVHMGGITFINTPRLIQENLPNHLVNSFLDINIRNGTLNINGLLKDEKCKPLIFFSGTEFKLFTGDFWDIIRKQGYLEFKNLTRKINLVIKQNNDLSLTLEGNLYLGHSVNTITFDELVIRNYARFKGTTIENSPKGIMIGG